MPPRDLRLRCAAPAASPYGRDRRRLFHLLLAASGLGGALGCGQDTATAPPSGRVVYTVLQLNQHAVNLATQTPYNTIQLTATPQTVTGTPVSAAGTVHFTASDSTVTVDSLSGLVTAHYVTPGQPTVVAAALTLHGVTLTDTVLIQVTDTVPQHPLATFSMQPAAGDSAKRAYDWLSANGLIWSVLATDAAGTALCNTRGAGSGICPLQVAYTSSDPTVATIDRSTGVVDPHETGQVVFTATTWAYGVTQRDSVVFTVGYNLLGADNQGSKYNTISVTSVRGMPTATFSVSPTLVLGVGAVMTFQDVSPRPVDVEFLPSTGIDTASCWSYQQYFQTQGTQTYASSTGGGSIAPFGGDTTWAWAGFKGLQFRADPDLRCRRFRTAGVYRYHSTVLPSTTAILIIHA